jgi:phosphate:Na+ symporter
MKLMSDSMAPLRTYDPFIQMLKGLEYPLLGLLVGTIFTSLIQSSSAFMGIIIVLAQQGVLTLEAGIPLMFGANLGTCITAWLASFHTSREAKRVALGHIFFKVAGVLIFITWIPSFSEFIQYISPSSDIEGIGKSAAEIPRQVANAHTLFNVSVGILFLPFTTLFGKLINKILPDKPILKTMEPRIWYLDENSLQTPPLALDLARAELARMTKILRRMLDAILYPLLYNQLGRDENHPELTKIEGIEMREKKIDFLQEKITDYLLKIERRPLSESQSREIFAMLSIAKSMESIGDVIKKSMVPLILKKGELNFDFSEEGKKDIEVIHRKVLKQLNRLQEGFEEKDIQKARKIIRKESDYLYSEQDFIKDHLKRVFEHREASVATHELHMDIMECLRQINYYIVDIAISLTRSYKSEAE